MKWSKIISLYSFVVVLVLTALVTNCDNAVKPEVFSEMTPETVLQTEDGVLGTLIAGYTQLTIRADNRINGSLEFTTDIAWETGGGATSGRYRLFTSGMMLPQIT